MQVRAVVPRLHDILHDDTPRPFAGSALGRLLDEAIARSAAGFQHSVSDLREQPSLPTDGGQHTIPGAPSLEFMQFEIALSMLPCWSSQAGCAISWFLQACAMYAKLAMETAPAMTILSKDGDDNIVARHVSGALAVWEDVPVFCIE